MSVTTKHSLYTNYTKQNRFMRDVISGDDAIKSAGQLYVPKLSGQDDIEYKAMIERAVFENYTSRTLDGMSGLIFAKAGNTQLPALLEQYALNIDLNASTLIDLSQQTISEVATVGRAGLLVDMASIDTTGMTAADVKKLNIRPYVKLYNSESIINWREEVINNVTTLVMVVLHETYQVWTTQFTAEVKDRYRVLELQEGIVRVTVWESADDKEFGIVSETYPMMNGKNMRELPFFPITAESLTINPAKAPLYDLAKVNLTHFKVDVDYSYGSHYTAIPTPWGAGVQMKQGETLSLGASVIHLFPDPNAKLGFLEFNGEGLSTLERKMETLKQSMATLGARMLQAESGAQIAENTMAMKTSGERAIIISLADTVSRGITKALELMAQWSGVNGNIVFELNTDYNLATIDAQTLTALVSANQLGVMPLSQLHYNFKKGEVFEETYSLEDFQGEIETSAPLLSVQPPK